MSSDLDVVNKALRHLGLSPVESLSANTSSMSRVLLDTLQSSLKAVLGSYEWSVNRHLLELVGTESTLPDYPEYRYSHSLSAPVDSYVVSGAGFTSINGTYVRNGNSVDGNPAYTLYDTDGLTALFSLYSQSGSVWVIATGVVDEEPAAVYAWQNISSPTPPLSGWSAVSDPAPTLAKSIEKPANFDNIVSIQSLDGVYLTKYQRIGDTIYTSVKDILITYTKTLDTVVDMPEYLASLVSAHIAMDGCMALTGDGNKYYVMGKIYDRELRRARAQEFRMSPKGYTNRPDNASSFIQAHSGITFQ